MAYYNEKKVISLIYVDSRKQIKKTSANSGKFIPSQRNKRSKK